MKKILFILSATGFLFLLFSHPDLASRGCSLGLQLWYTSVLPSLLPFLIVSSLLIQTGSFQYLNRLYAPVIGRIFRISGAGCYAVLLGFLCGFPMGAKIIGELVLQKQISEKEGTYLLGFCNNVSPAFFLNYVCMANLHYTSVPWKLAALFYGIPLVYGLLTRPFYHFTISDGRKKQAPLRRLDSSMLDTCIMDSFSTVTRLGGYIILFTIIVQLLTLLTLPDIVLAFAGGALEITCGVHALSSLSKISPPLKTAFVCACAAFGGLCTCAQTQSVLAATSLRIRTWLRGRIIIALLIFLLALLPAAVPALHGCW